GIASPRLAMILAVLERKLGLALSTADVFANVAGGLTIDEPAIDLPLAIAVASAVRDRPCARGLCAFGVIRVAGVMRGVSPGAARLPEPASMGFKRALVPASTADRIAPNERSGVLVIAVKRIDEAVRIALED